MERLVKVSEWLDRLVTRVGKIASWTAVLLIGVIMLDVVTRRFLVLGSTKLQELEWHLHAVLFAFCLGFAYIKDAHVRIDLVREKLNPRIQWWIELLGCLLFLVPYCVLVLYFGADWWYRSWAIDEASDSATGLPYRWLIKAVLPLGFVFLFLSGIAVMLRKIVELFGSPTLRARVQNIEASEIQHIDEVKLDDKPGRDA